ncbi:uncharacterized protein FPRO_13668 [Fusarium proliferatum ET1]|uniref:Uncharacterized protein n=1 Tax=Fusarium proliferatum (strain ET1) TaxID=1227346 RepID=A0A1L7VTW8_FUSPR|nr:uncharacterized protein FPRO_13668 [Fusarium proliferatum ET1]CZR43861.1 uncharacterized protein FPRO_13668 [Fusarium proliferatum ET1]
MSTKPATYLPPLMGLMGLMAFICSNLSLFAGKSHGVLEEAYIVRKRSFIGLTSAGSQINFPKLGQLAFNGATSQDDDLSSQIGDSVLNLTSNTLERFNMPDWYSIHVLNHCKGDFTSASGSSDIKFKVIECTGLGNKLISIDLEPLENIISDTLWLKEVESAVSIIGKIHLALALIYGVAISLSGIGLVACLFIAIMPTHLGVNYTAASVFVTSGLVIITASIVVTVAARTSVSKINSIKKSIEISATVGVTFLVLTWMTVAATMFAAMLSIYLSRKTRNESKISKQKVIDRLRDDHGIELGTNML